MKLQKKLDRIAAATAEQIPPQLLQIAHDSTQALVDSGLADGAPKVGDKAPALVLPGRDGDFDLHASLANGPVVLTWFRGNW